jgi:hypothetical protein
VQVWEDNVYIHDEYYRAGMTPTEHGQTMAEYFQRVGGIGYVPEYLICDPRSPDGIKDLKLTGWQAKAAPALDKRTQRDKPVIVGVKRVKRLLKIVDGKTKIHVHPRCVHMIEEFGLYEWVNNEPDPRKNNHCMDALRYGVVAEVDRGYGYEEEETEEEDILGKDIEDDFYDPDESFGMQILRQRQRDRELAEKARCS